jgi:AraC family transcriptional regulator
MDDAWVRRARTAICHFDKRCVFDSGPIVSLVSRICIESRRDDAASALSVEGLMLQMLGAFGRIAAGLSAQPAPPWLRAAEEILRSKFRSPPTTQELAAIVGVHRAHLARAFRSHHGQTVGEFVLRHRVDYACKAILCSRRSLTDIAIESGFFDQSHFTKTLRRITGVTPARFRQSA